MKNGKARCNYKMKTVVKNSFLKAICILFPTVFINRSQVSLTESCHANVGEKEMSYTDRKAFSYALFEKRASFTVEAALVLPVFMALMFGVLSIFNLVSIDFALRGGLCEAARTSALAAHVTDEEAKISDAVGYGIDMATAQAVTALGVADAPGISLVEGGAAGVICTVEDDGNYVEITGSCAVRIPLLFFGKRSYLISETVRARKWTGYDPTEGADGDSDEEMVYITPSGVAYHRDRDCAYLNPSIQPVSYAQVAALRNSSGHKYYACPLCSKNPTAVVYITTYGEKYHSSVTCSGLKRTIYCVPLSQVGSRHACGKCAGGK